MDYALHLPLLGFAENQFSLDWLRAYVQAARRLGYAALSINDHLLYSRAWLDGPVALAAALPDSGSLGLFTTVALPIVRGPMALARALVALDVLSGGRLTVAVGPGSSPRDYAAVGIPFEERWKRLDDAVPAMRAVWRNAAYAGRFYNYEAQPQALQPAQPGGPPLWIGSWGSEAGLRRVARLADGWLASAYNATPADFAAGWARLRASLVAAGKDPAQFPNGLATMFFHITDDAAQAAHILANVLGPTLNRPPAELRERLLIGPAAECAEKLAAYRAAGVQRVFLWPVTDELRQIELFRERVAPTADC